MSTIRLLQLLEKISKLKTGLIQKLKSSMAVPPFKKYSMVSIQPKLALFNKKFSSFQLGSSLRQRLPREVERIEEGSMVQGLLE